MNKYAGMPPFFGENELANGWFFPEEGKLYQSLAEGISEGNIVEIGSFEGLSLSYLRRSIKTKSNKVWAVEKRCTDILKNNAENWGVKLLCSDSENASSLFPDEFFDLVFIDANHSYKNVKNDILCWLPKLKQGGTISGHDYCDAWPGVKQAVDEIFAKFKLHTTCWETRKEWIRRRKIHL
jgi:predicted O-methyltransferase YrrM